MKNQASKIITSLLFSSLLNNFSFAHDPAAPAAPSEAPAQAQEQAAPAAASASAVATGSAQAFQRSYGLAGCGLGSVVIGKRGGQIFASTTNGTLSNQFFGISFGTLGCVDPASAKVASRVDQFMQINRGLVEVEMTRGSGERLDALAEILGCQKNKEFSAHLKANYSKIFDGKAEKSHGDITDSIITEVLQNDDLRTSCSNLKSFS